MGSGYQESLYKLYREGVTSKLWLNILIKDGNP
jgi:hypothetical protein